MQRKDKRSQDAEKIEVVPTLRSTKCVVCKETAYNTKRLEHKGEYYIVSLCSKNTCQEKMREEEFVTMHHEYKSLVPSVTPKKQVKSARFVEEVEVM